MVLNEHSKELREIMKKENSFLLANIDLKNSLLELDTVWHGFSDRCELRGPRFTHLKRALKFSEMGYDIIVFNKKSMNQWLMRGTGKGIFHISIIKQYFPSIMNPSLSVSSVKHGGFFSPYAEEGIKLHRKKANRSERKKIKNDYENQCYLCNSKIDLSLHHILPKKFGGGTEIDNLVPLCSECHDKAHSDNRMHLELMKLRYSKIFSNLVHK